MKRILSVAMLSIIALIFSGCLGLFSIASGDQPGFSDNALQVGFERPPSAAVNDFQQFVANNGMKVSTVSGSTLRTEPGTFGQATSGGQATPRTVSGPKVRLIAKAEPDDGGSELTIVTEYLDPAAGKWQRGEFSASLLSPGGGRGSSDTQVIRRLHEALTRRYGTDNISHVSSDLNYSSGQAASAQSERNESEARSNERPAPSTSEASDEERDTTPSDQQSAERPGNGGDDTAWVQRTLNEFGHDCGPEDGVMGSNTRSCIRSFQEANGLEATGEVNEATYQAMLERR